MTLYLITNHNYYNRQIVRYETIAEYEEAFGFEAVIGSVNFIVNDGITTTQIVNYDTSALGTGEISASYLLVVSGQEIISRWWITESVVIRNGQARLSLMRDVVADYKDTIFNSPSFLMKGYVGSIYDPAIYNNEDMTFNQIKQFELPIQDDSLSGWLVGYISQESGNISVNVPGVSEYTLTGDYSTDADFPYNQYLDPNTPYFGDYTDLTLILNTYPVPDLNAGIKVGWDQYGNPKVPTIDVKTVIKSEYGAVYYPTEQGKGFPWYPATGGRALIGSIYISNAVKEVSTSWKDPTYTFTGTHRGTELNTFLELDNKYVRIAGQVYKIKLKNNHIKKVVNIPNDAVFATQFRNVAVKANELNPEGTQLLVNQPSGSFASIEFEAPGYYITLEPQTTKSVSYTLPGTRNHCVDAPYDLICFPYSDKLYVDGKTKAASMDLARQIVNKLIEAMPDNSSYDWQLLPYCPIDDDVFSNTLLRSRLYPDRLTDETWYDIIEDPEQPSNYTIVLYPRYSNFNKISRAEINKLLITENPIDFKTDNACNMYRLCSPNMNGQFEFSATKNMGVESYNISCSYKPHQPYIRVSPNFGGLYGREFADGRGLICGGDFTIPQTTNAWNQYELNNKNYQTMFDRQIENMEVNNAIQRKMEKVNVIAGTLQGAASTGVAGGMLGGGIGAGIGAIAGGLASAWAGQQDIKLNDKLRAEALDYTKDQFGYQLQNIQALPNSLTKIGAATNDFKIWPFLEYYTCSIYERQAFVDKITWNGMTIGRIGTISNFLNPNGDTFIQAKPIRLDANEIQDDAKLFDVISAELQTGVYIK